MTTRIEVSKVGGNTSFPWMIVYVAFFPGLLKSTCFRIIEYHIFLVPQNYVVRWWEGFVIGTTSNFPFTTITPITPGNIAKKEGKTSREMRSGYVLTEITTSTRGEQKTFLEKRVSTGWEVEAMLEWRVGTG